MRRPMTAVADRDPILESLLEELRSELVALNQLHHPVYAGDPRRVTELEQRVEELRADIAARRRVLAPAPA